MHSSDEQNNNGGVGCLVVFVGKSLHSQDGEPILFVLPEEMVDEIYSGNEDYIWALISCIADEASVG